MDLNNIVSGLAKRGAVSGFAGGLAGTAMDGEHDRIFAEI